MKITTNHQISTPNNKNSIRIKPHTSEYTCNRIYLENSLNQLSFLGKTSLTKKLTKTEFLKKHSLLLDDWAYTDNILEFISEFKDGSKELQDVDTFLECFDSRKYDPKFGEPSFYITPRAKKMFKSFKKGRELPQGLSDDLTMIRQGGSVIDNYIPVLSSEKALSTKKVGDLFQIGEKDRVCILNRKGEIEELKMTRAD
ncbi:MAG: hypothetical protein IKR34_04800, partial [Candidatus Gastranaerophilales bacterium]|nr:hypothetical protein [Candidatus Gastranaerophilales bacterium]